MDPKGPYTKSAATSLNSGTGGPISRGRGRPRQNFDFTKIDPTTELFLKSEGRAGGPTDPTIGFDQASFFRESRSLFTRLDAGLKIP